MMIRLSKLVAPDVFFQLRIHINRNMKRTFTSAISKDTRINIYNTATRNNEKFIVNDSDVVRWYLCGPTVYDSAHVGHAISFIRFDLIRRILERFLGYTVVQVMSVTDIDDKIIQRAKEQNEDPYALARYYEQEFFEDMTELRNLPPTLPMRVTDNIDTIIRFIESLISRDMAYATKDGSVYFDVTRDVDYGRFGTKLVVSEDSSLIMESGKKSKVDFALWRGRKVDSEEPVWNSPWGPGRPGWHIECSAMASRIFGAKIDIHSGGKDLMFPHHENELAQSCAYHQTTTWVGHWLHSGTVNVGRGKVAKMSKSLGNIVTVREFLQSRSADELRMFCLRAGGYNNDVVYDETSLAESSNVLRKLAEFAGDAESYLCGQHRNVAVISEDEMLKLLNKTRSDVQHHLCDDFGYDKATKVVTELAAHTGRLLRPASPSYKAAGNNNFVGTSVAAVLTYVRQFFDHFGIALPSRYSYGHIEGSIGNDQNLLPQAMDALVDFRSKVRVYSREKKQFELLKECDNLRDQLSTVGLQIKDSHDCSTWLVNRPISNQPSPALKEAKKSDRLKSR